MRKAALAITVTLVLLSLAVPFSSSLAKDKALAIGTDRSADGMILGRLILRLLKDRGYRCRDMTGLGSKDLVRAALINGQIDLYPAYTGWVTERYLGGWKDSTVEPKTAFEKVSGEDLSKNKLLWLGMMTLEKKPRIWLRDRYARSRRLKTISDLAAVTKSKQHKPIIGLSPGFLVDDRGYRPMAQTYGIDLPDTAIIKMDPVFLYPALMQRGVDLVVGRTLDWEPGKHNLVYLKDNLGFFKPNNHSYVVRVETAQQFPGLRQDVSELNQLMTSDEMGLLLGRLAEGSDLDRITAQWLKDKGLIK